VDEGLQDVSDSLRRAHSGREDRRAYLRTVCAGTAVIDVLSPQPRKAVPVRILDVADLSLKMSVPFFLSPGAIVRIHLTESLAHAEVRYCTCEGSEYHAGIKIEEIVPKE
jgi:hypothetical protein